MKNFKKYFLFLFVLSIIITSFAIFNKVVAVDTCPGTPTVSYGGKTYNTVQIGTQCWLKENLNIGNMVNVSQEQANNSVVEKYCYNNSESNCDIYGGLYQWGEAVQYKNGATNTTNWSPVPTEVQGICPAGWRMPTNTEYATLWTYLGGQGVAGGKLKEVGITHWKSPNVGATNSSNFTLLAGGSRWGSGAPAGTFTYFFWEGYFWTTTTGQIPATDAWYGGATYSITGALNGQFYKNTGLSIRCIKSVGDVASVSIIASANPVVAGTSVTFTATPNNGGTAPTYQWKKNGTNINGATNATYTYVPINGDSITVVMTSNLPGVTGSPATSNSITMSVTSLPPTSCPGTPTVSYGGKTYDTVQIGTQCWLKQDLDIGTMINNTSLQTNNNTIEKYCYADSSSNCSTYGGLYQWNEAMQYSTTEGAQGICPSGWHIPTKVETETMSTYLGSDGVAGGKLKEAGTTRWKYPNMGATNSSNFTALPTGYSYRYNTTPLFSKITENSYITTSTQNLSTADDDYVFRGLLFTTSGLTSPNNYKSTAVSVRCLKNGTSVPGQSTNLTGTFGLFSTSASLTWTAPTNNGGSPITSYLVEYKQVSATTWTASTPNPTTTSKTITGLVAGNSYDYRVSAVNAIGTGPSVSITAPGQVTGLTATVGNGQVTLNWTAPSNGGSPLTNYIIDYKLTSASVWSSITIPYNSTTKVITNLTNGSSYDFKVRAWGSSAGAWSSTISSTPVAPIASVSISGIFNGTNTVFTATPTNSGTTPTYQWKKNGVGVTGATNSTYTYDPAIGEMITCVMNNTVTSNTISPPAKVMGITATPGNGQVTLNWTTPNNGGSPLTTYAVRYKLSSALSFINFPHPASTVTSIVIPGLTNGQSYNFFVKAVNVDNRNNGGTPSDVVSTSPVAFVSGSNLVAGVINAESMYDLGQATNIDTMSNLDQGTIEGESFTKSLYFRKNHSEVKKLQKFLNENGYIVKVNGAGSLGNETEYFGEATRLALIKFQKEHNIIPANGKLGPLTRTAINKILNSR